MSVPIILSPMIQAQQCASLIHQAQCIGVLTGAGISTNAGIPDFRGPQGLYVTRKYDPEKVFDISYFYRDQKPFFDFARDFVIRRTSLSETSNHPEQNEGLPFKPTITHKFFADLEKSGKCKGVVTQNIDSLHQMAGSKNVFEMHGSFWKNYCLDCGQEFSFEQIKEKLIREEIPKCPCGGVIKPDIVFFGENVKYLTESEELASECDLFLVVGTSCVVYPAAMVPQYAKGRVVVVNQSPIEIELNNVVLDIREDIDQFFQKVGECL